MRRFRRSLLVALALVVGGGAGGETGGGGATDGALPPIALRLPLDCVPGQTCEIIKYVDNDPGPGMRDYACGNRTGGENGYGSTSIAIQDRKAMAAGVTVRAAAAGIVDTFRDEMADTGVYGPESREELTKVGCGNAVVLRHDGGWRTVYCHMKRGSVRVRPGDQVAAGAPLGQVGMSGLSELPHLYFSVRLGNTIVDPFVGRIRPEGCGVGERPLWDPAALKALVYKPVLLRLAGFATVPPNVVDARQGSYAQAALPRDTGALFFWVEIIGVKAGDVLTLRITAPDGRVLSNGSSKMERSVAQNFVFGKADRPGAAWPAGTYRGTATIQRDGDTFVTSAHLDMR